MQTMPQKGKGPTTIREAVLGGIPCLLRIWTVIHKEDHSTAGIQDKGWRDAMQFVQVHWKWNEQGSVWLKFDSKWVHRNSVIFAVIVFGKLDRSTGGREFHSLGIWFR